MDLWPPQFKTYQQSIRRPAPDNSRTFKYIQAAPANQAESVLSRNVSSILHLAESILPCERFERLHVQAGHFRDSIAPTACMHLGTNWAFHWQHSSSDPWSTWHQPRLSRTGEKPQASKWRSNARLRIAWKDAHRCTMQKKTKHPQQIFQTKQKVSPKNEKGKKYKKIEHQQKHEKAIKHCQTVPNCSSDIACDKVLGKGCAPSWIFTGCCGSVPSSTASKTSTFSLSDKRRKSTPCLLWHAEGPGWACSPDPSTSWSSASCFEECSISFIKLAQAASGALSMFLHYVGLCGCKWVCIHVSANVCDIVNL